MIASDVPPFIRSVILERRQNDQADVYPFSIPAVPSSARLALSQVTYFIGENGSGKSTILST